MRLNTDQIQIFQEQTVPENARLVGWSALVQAFGIQAPVRRPAAVSDSHVRGSRRAERTWNLFDKRYWPGEDFGDQLGFALRHEEIDLVILKRIFQSVPQETVVQFVRDAPTGAANRRVWFLYEFLTGVTLEVPEPTGTAIDLLNADEYFTGTARLSRRHKVRDNLLGTSRFCPILRRTTVLNDFVGRELGRKANEIIGRTGKHVVSARPISCFWPTAGLVLKSKGNGRRVGAWNDGAARCSRPVRIR